MMIELMTSEIKNARFIAVAENLKFKEILTRITKELGKPAPKKQLKYWQLEIGRVLDFVWSSVSGSTRRITKSSIHSMKHRDEYSNKKIKDFLDFEFENLNDTIVFSCERFKEENL